jgi:hypothetical protein
MSLQPQAIPPIPEETIRVARAILPKTMPHALDILAYLRTTMEYGDLKRRDSRRLWRFCADDHQRTMIFLYHPIS